MKSPTQQFIEDAIAGGCPKLLLQNTHDPDWSFDYGSFLRPAVWQAVGKTRAWREPERGNDFPEAEVLDLEQTGWNARWHHFIDHLASGRTIEEALAAIQ